MNKTNVDPSIIPPVIQENQEQTTNQSDNSQPFKALGFDSGVYYLMSMNQLQVLALKAAELSQNNLLQLADLDWWISEYPTYNADGVQSKKPDWGVAVNDIMRSCETVGVYSPESVRGRGFWRDGDRVIRHLGDHLRDVTVNNDISMLDNSLEGVYQRSRAINIPDSTPATKNQIKRFSEAVNTIYWQHESHADLFMGWIALAPLCGLLEWRPHLWISGEHGCGKSDTALECITVGIGKKQVLHAKDSTTEAGLRQTLKADSIPVALDEMEPNTSKDRGRIDRILSLARNASSDDEASTLKGTITGNSASYRIRSMFCYASINTHLPELADQSRTTILDIEKRPQTDQSKKDFELIKRTLLELERESFGYSLTNLITQRMGTLLANLGTFIEVAGDTLGSARDGKQYGTLLAGFATMLQAEPVTSEQAKAYLAKIHIKDAVSENRDTETTGWDECWSKMSSIMLDMRDSRSRITVGESLDILKDRDLHAMANIVGVSTPDNIDSEQTALLSCANRGEKEIRFALRRLGIIYQNSKESLYGCSGEGIYLSNKSESMQKALSGTPFESWLQYSKRIGKTANQNKVIKFSGFVSKAKFINI